MTTTARRVTRTFGRRGVRVETFHPEAAGDLPRGVLRVVGVAPYAGPGVGPTLIWRGTDYDHTDLGTFAGNYIDAERWLLDATAELD